MSALIDRLFSKSQADAIRELWDDKSSRLLIEQQIGVELIESQEIIDLLPLTQIMLITSLASFSTSEDERHGVAEIICWGINKNDILPYLTDHVDGDIQLAYKCLISLGFFKSALQRRCDRHGAPTPDFYRRIGIATFNRHGFIEIGDHFYQWESFMSEMFV